MSEDRISGKVARVTSDRELIINRGLEHGVEMGMHFVVKGAPIDIVDPETDEVIGQVSPIKVIVRVDEVSERFSIARTFRTHRFLVEAAQKSGSLYESMGAGSALNRMLQPPRPAKYETRVETLRVDPKKGAPIAEQDSVVDVGDDVESVLEGDDMDPATTTLYR